MKRLYLLKLLMLVMVLSAQAQQLSFAVSEGSTMNIAGTSTLQDWSCEVTEIAGTISLSEKLHKKGLKAGDKIDAVTVSVPVLSIKSPRGATMEQKIYNALKSESSPNITFKLTANEVLKAEKDGFTVEATGNLEIAGKTKPVTLQVKGTKLSGEAYSFEGSHKLNMKDFEVEPPSAMFGQIVTEEEVEISFNLIVKN